MTLVAQKLHISAFFYYYYYYLILLYFCYPYIFKCFKKHKKCMIHVPVKPNGLIRLVHMVPYIQVPFKYRLYYSYNNLTVGLMFPGSSSIVNNFQKWLLNHHSRTIGTNREVRFNITDAVSCTWLMEMLAYSAMERQVLYMKYMCLEKLIIWLRKNYH